MNIPLRAATSQEVLYESTQAQIRGVRNLLARNLQCWGIDYGFVSTVDAEERRQGVRDVRTIIALLEDAQDRDSMDGERGGLCFPRGLGSLDRIESGWSKQRFRETDRRRQAQMVETLRVIRDMRREMSDMQAELLALSKQQGELDSQDQS
ncbi:hypothetical protein Tco_1006469 [Tanacetum coccineum]|uniref:Uncharacterized protein n=1 Tax=Tanacetum coccineum TaxID=301880 RepID=A0ABQ5FHY6_9ASTR